MTRGCRKKSLTCLTPAHASSRRNGNSKSLDWRGFPPPQPRRTVYTLVSRDCGRKESSFFPAGDEESLRPDFWSGDEAIIAKEIAERQVGGFCNSDAG